MSCCGQRRHAARTPARAGGSLVSVEYRGREVVEVKGPSGADYVFSPQRAIQAVDPRDARSMLRAPGFRLV